MDKSLPVSMDAQPPMRSKRPAVVRILLGLILLAGLLIHSVWHSWSLGPFSPSLNHHRAKASTQCQQPPALFPVNQDETLRELFDYLSTASFENGSIARLSGAVQVRTESFDDLGPIGEDPRWDVFYGFFDYLKTTFPAIHARLEVEHVNTHGLVYTWHGSDKGLKPLILMAHQDVVPVPDATVDSWTHPPFSGFFDGERIWGRGASDCKNTLIGELEAVELLLKHGFEPKRTIVLSFGFDEECSGRQGAGHLAPFLLERYGHNGAVAIIDEGSGYTEAFGRGFAMPGVAEKGATDVDIVVRTPGGHSSIPADHTSIGILAEIVTAIEAEQYRTYLADDNPFLGFLYCSAEYAPEFPKKLRKLLNDRRPSSSEKQCKAKADKLAIEVAKDGGPAAKYLMQTSQAVDIINGGMKVNALPETVTVTVNHRINIGDSPETVWRRLAHVAKPIAEKYNLSLHAFDGVKDAYNGISLSARNTTLPVAPITPTNTDGVTPYTVIAGTIRALFGEDTIVAPGLMTGNTDTRYYWDITDHIFRFVPGYINEPEPGLGKIHTVDESIRVSNHFKIVKWYTLFLQNIDAAELD